MKNILDKIEQHPIIPVFYEDDLDQCKFIVTSCYSAGIRVLEFVNRGINALKNFEELVKFRNENFPDLLLAIGTIKTKKEAEDFLKIGADFIVSPIINPEIAEVTIQKNILWIPGVMTPTEIAKAEELNVPLVKLFPSHLLGPTFLSSISPLFSSLKFMPTGGIDIEENTIKDWFTAGVSAIGMGAKLFKDIDKDQEILNSRIHQITDWIQQAKA